MDCRNECADRPDVGFFAYNGDNCACYLSDSGCPDDNRHNDHKAYRILKTGDGKGTILVMQYTSKYAKITYNFHPNVTLCMIAHNDMLFSDNWVKEKKKFCPYCNRTYYSLANAKLACENDPERNVIYDLFCDNSGYFCICPFTSVLRQTHPRGIDCIYVKNN